MGLFESGVELAGSPEAIFDFLTRPANLMLVTPPELQMSLVEGPERLGHGSKIVIQGRRWGITQRIVSEVTLFEAPFHFVDEQRQGPFGRFVHRHRLEKIAGGARMLDQIEFAPPGGIVGLMMTEQRIRKDLEWVFAVRTEKFREIFGGL